MSNAHRFFPPHCWLKIFNGENILFQKLPELVNRCLVAPDPITLHYTINPTIPAPERPMAWDVEVKTEDTALKSKMTVMVQGNKESMTTLAKLDEDVRLCRAYLATGICILK